MWWWKTRSATPSSAACLNCECGGHLLPTSVLLLMPSVWPGAPTSLRAASLLVGITSLAYHTTHDVTVKACDVAVVHAYVAVLVWHARRACPASKAIISGMLWLVVYIFYVRPPNMRRIDGGVRTNWHVLLHILGLVAAAVVCVRRSL